MTGDRDRDQPVGLVGVLTCYDISHGSALGDPCCCLQTFGNGDGKGDHFGGLFVVLPTLQTMEYAVSAEAVFTKFGLGSHQAAVV